MQRATIYTGMSHEQPILRGCLLKNLIRFAGLDFTVRLYGVTGFRSAGVSGWVHQLRVRIVGLCLSKFPF